MNKMLRRLFLLIQVGIIVCAVLFSIVRLGAPHLQGYEIYIESWFKEQGIQADIDRLSLNVDGFTPEITIVGLTINDENDKTLITLDRATFQINVLHSLLQQRFIIDKAGLALSKAVINTELFQSSGDVKNTPLLSPEIIQSLLAFKRFTLKIDQLDIVTPAKKTVSLYQSLVIMTGEGEHKVLTLNTALQQQKKPQLNGQVLLNLNRLLSTSSISGEAYVTLNIASLNDVTLFKQYELIGDISINNWVKFDGFNVSLQSQFNAQKLKFSIGQKTHEINADSLLSVQFKDGLLNASLEHKTLRFNQVDLKQVKASAQSTLQSDKKTSSLILIENLGVKDVKHIAQSIPALKAMNRHVKALKPKGQLQEVFLQIPDLKQLKQTHIAIKAKGLQWKAYKGIPAVNYVVMDLVANERKFSAKVKANNLNVNLIDLYTQPFAVKRLSATVNGNMSADGLLLEIPDIRIDQNKAKIAGRMSLSAQKSRSPYMFLRLQAQNASIATVKPFLPQVLMDKDVLNWVKGSVKKANIKTADILYAGRLENDVNFDVKHNGVFETALNIENIDLLYDTHWPSLQSKKINLTFKNYQLFANSLRAQSLGLNVNNLSFIVEDLENPQAQLNLKVKDQFKKQWAFLEQSPIKNDIPYFSSFTQLGGSATTQVSASFSLSDFDAKPQFNVTINAHKAGFSLDKFGVQVSEVSGDININQEGINIEPLNAHWFGQPVTVEASSEEGSIRLKMHGDDINVATLLNVLPKSAKKHISGSSAWEINALFPKLTKNSPLVSIEAHSGLKGTSINLPEPLNLSDSDALYLKVGVDVYDTDNIDVQVTLDSQMDAFLKFKLNDDGQYDVWGADIQFGKETLEPLKKKGVRFLGNIEHINVDHWTAYVSLDKGQSASSHQNYLALIQSIDLSIEQLQLKNIEAQQTKLVVNNGKNGLLGSVSSSIAKGTFFIPVKQPNDIPVDIDLEFIDVTIKEGLANSEKPVYKTDSIPNLNFKTKRLSVSGKHFTDVKLEIESHKKHQFILKNLSLKHKKLVFNASGQWIYNEAKNKHVSLVKLKLNGNEFGQSLTELGMGKGIENGEVAFNGELTWPAEFWALDLADAKGKVAFKLSDGYLLDVDPAAGRFVGLLSLSALPRRLTLDFSDFFKEGLEFDEIKGDFLIHDGSMWTTNLKMTGSVSDVNLVGRTGLKAKDYDQVITIIPQVRDALPVLGSIVAGSTVGWALLLFQRLFKDPIDDSVSIKYKVTGHWDAPKIDLIEKPKPDVIEEL